MEFILNLCGRGSLWRGMSILTKGSGWTLVGASHREKIRTKNEGSMIFQDSRKVAVAIMLAFVMLAGCKSKEDAAIDKAKQQAAATGQPQQVVSTDKNGNVTTTT